MSKVITKFDFDLVQRAVNRIAEPVIQTLTPLGNNVMFEKDFHTFITNDGVTIAKMIDAEDPTEDAIIHMIKYGSLSTNQIAGDGTSTTILFSKRLIDIGIERLKSGTKPMELKKEFSDMRDAILSESASHVKQIGDNDLFKIALISSGGDQDMASNVESIIETSGTDGMVFINESKNQKTNIIKDSGYNLDEPMFDPVLGNITTGRADYVKPHVFVTDKKLYHIEECKEILEKAYEAGARNIVVVARDFLGEAPGFLISNHMDEKVPLSILLVKYTTPDNDTTSLYDLATYLGGPVVTEKMGSLKGKLTSEHYIPVERVYSFGPKTIFVTNDKTNPELSMLVQEVREKKEQDPEDTVASKRLASLTAGTVTLEVGGATGPELRELIYRYEDAINAARAAIKSGYVTGGGLTLYNTTRELTPLAEEFGRVSVEQIAKNTGIEFKEDMYGGSVGYNAKTGKYSDLEEDGVIEPYDVFKHSIINAVSVATAILTSGYIIVNKRENEND